MQFYYILHLHVFTMYQWLYLKHFTELFYQGINILITVWDSDPANNRVPYDEVDEFDYDLTDEPGSNPRILTIEGIRPDNKTR